jgi:phosphopantothenoylcysteine decarboxylase/phosphopantothenate--cysteine ligase
VGSSLADYAASEGWEVRLLLGPNAQVPADAGVEVIRFGSAQDLEDALAEHLDWCDCLIMAAAVADYRPKPCEVDCNGKRRRTGDDMSIELESTPDLLAGCSKQARENQLLVGFALEPADQLEASALRKLAKKNIDLIVANPLETMDSDTIEARLIGNPIRGLNTDISTDGCISKSRFAAWLIQNLSALVEARRSHHTTSESSSHASL